MKQDKTASPITEKSLFYWAFKDNLKLQLILLVIIIVIVFARVIPLEMQKRIINDSIALRNLQGLFLYCTIYIIAITTASALKLAINYLQAVIGERAMTAMRKELYHHILSLSLGFFRTTQPGMVVSSLMTELSTAGTFAGMAFAVPVTNILTLLAFAGYLLWLNPKLAGATLLIYPVVVFIVPLLQKRANKANKQRVDLSRTVSSQIAESISGIHEIQVHGAYRQEGRKFDNLAERLKKIRIRWSLFRFGIKTANNYFVGLGPFVVFIFGGYLVMHGQLALGSMVAFLSAQEKLFDPWKELIDFYQTYQDASVRYNRTMGYFDSVPEFSLDHGGKFDQPLTGRLEVSNLVYDTSDGHRLLNGISFSLAAGEHLAVVGYSGGGKSTLIQCIGKMFNYSAGSIKLDDLELSSLPKNEIIQKIGYVSQNPFIFTGSIEENLLYAYTAASEAAAAPPTEEMKIDLDRMILVLQQVGLFVDVMRFGLDSFTPPDDQETAAKIISIRRRFREGFEDKLADYVEFYHQDVYHKNSNVAENILFGTSTSKEFGYKLLPNNADFLAFLKSVDLLQPLFSLGIELASQAVDILAGVDTVDLFFKNSPVPADKLEKCETILIRLKTHGFSSLSPQSQSFLLSLALNFTPSIHTMSRLPKELKESILSARKVFPEWCQSIAPDLFTSYGETSYIHGQSILNNIFFGRIKPGLPQAQEIINQSIMHLLVEQDYLEKIAAFGMRFQVGTMGDRLSGGQRQKLAIARVLIKQPKMILMDEATSALDNKSQARIQRLMTSRWKGNRTVIAAVHRLDIIGTFDKVAVMKAGKLVEFGTYHELIEHKGILHELIYGRR
ncbi:MAG: ATP-binding cassette domain-containing protein [Desulfobulbaceae bacterium]|nr:ATP-binding cassette domain-containing protein [Desulfobulbaceae bacterium]